MDEWRTWFTPRLRELLNVLDPDGDLYDDVLQEIRDRESELH